MIIKKNILIGVKKIAEKEINKTIDGKCLFLCYQPKIPKQLKRKVK
ncbi:cyclic lactone autoinducer peptide [Coprobacillus cateniformis]